MARAGARPQPPAIAAPHELVRRPLERRRRGGPPQHDLLDLPRQLEVLVGDAAGAVRGQLHRDLAPTSPTDPDGDTPLRPGSRSRSPASASSASRRSCMTRRIQPSSKYQPGSSCSLLGDLRPRRTSRACLVIDRLRPEQPSATSHSAAHQHRLPRSGTRPPATPGTPPPPPRPPASPTAASGVDSATAAAFVVREPAANAVSIHPGASTLTRTRGGELARQRLAEREHAALDRGEDLGSRPVHAGEDVIPGHVDDHAAGPARAGGAAACHDARIVPRRSTSSSVELLHVRQRRALAGQDVRAGVVDPDVHARRGA